MAERDKKKGIVCRSPVDFERVFLPNAFERREREKTLKEPGGFGKNLEKELIRSLRRERSPRGTKKT